MDGIDIFDKHQWQPLSIFGFTHPFFSVDADTMIYTWVALGIILIFALIGRLCLRYPHRLAGHIVKKYIRSFMIMIEESFHHFEYRYFAFITVLFTFLVVCNCIIVIPTMEEPTGNLNTTISLSIISFLYTQKESIRVHGLLAYLNEYFKTPLQVFGRNKPVTLLFILDTLVRVILNIIIGALLLPIELLGKLASILSLSFRLFGNIFGGSVISGFWMQIKSKSILLQILGIITGLNLILILFFGLFEGLIQAFVFSILSLTYLSMAVRTHSE
jgi:F-type H+-transporting ATPase subunit a